MQTKTIIEIYHDVLSEERTYFPMYTWDQPDSKEQLIKLARYIMLEMLQMNRQDVLEQINLEFLTKHKIGSAVRRCYKKEICNFVNECFPEWEVKPWEFKKTCVPVAYWNEETMTAATKWLINDVLKWDLEKVQNEISNSYFHDNNLGGMLRTLNVGAMDAVVLSYPEHDWTYLKERRGYKITDKQALEIRRMYSDGTNMYELARLYNVNPTSIFYIIHNLTFKKAPYES